jgi:hypothetical protein
MDESLTAGYSQTRLLLLLHDEGPTEPYRAYWRSRAASKTWPGTVYWTLEYGWIFQQPDGRFEITPAGVLVLGRSYPEKHAAIREEFRSPGDRYWLDREARALRAA